MTPFGSNTCTWLCSIKRLPVSIAPISFLIAVAVFWCIQTATKFDTNTSAQRKTTAPVQQNNQTYNKCVTMSLACCNKLALNSKLIENRTVVYKTSFLAECALELGT